MNSTSTLVHIYACYLPGSKTPDYVGSHAAEPSARSSASAWRYDNCRYLGQGCWVDKEGIIVDIPRINRVTLWGKRLVLMSAAERNSISIDILATVDVSKRWKVEAQMIRDHQPPFNMMGLKRPETKEEKQAKLNAYQREYMPAYLASHPEFKERKRQADKLRQRIKRAAMREAKKTIA